MESPLVLLGKVIFVFLILPMVAAGGAFFNEVMLDGPVGYYRLDEVAGTVAEDSSGNNGAGFYGGVALPQLGIAGYTAEGNGAVAFSGSAADKSYIEVPALLNPAMTSFTLEALVSVNATGANQIIFQQKDAGGTGRTLLRVAAGGEVDSFIGGAARKSGKVVQAGEAIHVVMTFSRTGMSAGGEGEGTLAFYVDGVAYGTMTVAGASGVEPNDGAFVLGNQKGLNGQYFGGVMDEVVFYDKALTEERVAEHYRSIAEESLVGSFSASPAGIEAGQSTVLNWEVAEGVTSVSLDQGIGSVDAGSGELVVSPGVTTEYTLTVSDGVTSESRSVAVVVGTAGPYRLSEMMADNSGPLEDEDGEESDWIELRNLGNIAGDLAGWYLTDDATNLTKWAIPSGAVPGDGFLLVFASGKDRVGESGELHTNFKLSQDGECLALVEPDGVTVHHEFAGGYPPQVTGVSWGEGYFLHPTPGSENGESAAGFVEEEVVADVERGFFEEPFQVTLSTTAAGAEIYYTVNGNEPTPTNGLRYSVPLTIETTTTLRAGAFRENEVPLKVMTQTYLFLDDVLDQPNNVPGYPSVWQPSVTADYAMDDSAKVGTREEIAQALRDLPTVSLVMERDDWFNNSTDPAVGGIYANSVIARGAAWERKVSAEFFGFPHGKEIQVDAGMRIFGNASRATSRKKHNMRLVFRSGYGASKLVFPLFGDDGDDDEVNSYLLRGQNGDSWFHPTATQREEALYIRDQLARDLQERMGQPATKQDHVHLYINGLYWGVFNTIERIEGDSMAAAYGGKKEDWDVVKASPPSSVEAEDGTLAAWDEVVSIAGGDLSQPANYAAIQEKLDLENFIDWLLVNFYNGNSDWDHNNWQAVRRRGGDDRFRFFVWDSERSLLGETANSVTKSNLYRPTGIHQRLRMNADYRALFADRAHRHLFNEGALTPESARVAFNGFVQRLRSPLVAESARWGDAQRAGNPYAVKVEWLGEVTSKFNGYFPQRTTTVLNQLRAQGLYPSVVAPEFGKFGGVVPAGYSLPMSAQGQEIRYTLDGSDPGDVSGLVYTGPVTLDEPVVVKARALSGGTWSALTSAAFPVSSVPAMAGNVVISEVHYHPQSDDGGEEFVELMNIGNVPVDLRGSYFGDGIKFVFSGETNAKLWVINPGERVVLVGGESDFAAVHGELGSVVMGKFSGDFNNAGERIALIARDGSLIDEVTYADGADWPEAADGDGYSLVRILTDGGDANQPQSWRRSVALDGNPGTGDGVEFEGEAGVDSDGDGLDDLLEFALGTAVDDAGEGAGALEMHITGEGWAFGYPVGIGADGVRLVVEKSVDLDSWVEAEDLELLSRSFLSSGQDWVVHRVPTEQVLYLRLKAVRD